MLVFVKTLGCRANRYESEKLMSRLVEAGHSIVGDPEDAEVVLVNTCTVTHVADRKSRQEIYPHSGKKVVIFGCGPRVNKEAFSEIEGVSFVATEPDEVIDYLGKGSGGEISDVLLTRSNLKIQDGCENFCTYCIVPFARGKLASKPYDEVLLEAANMVRNGAKEIVLTGINIGNWKSQGLDFWGLMMVLLEELPVRVRISSIEPFTFEERVEEVLKHPRLCKHLHICLQSGSDSVLKKMGRKYDVSEFEDLIGKIRNVVPDIAVTTDAIVGFPGETDKEHTESMRVIKRIGFAKVHVFKYSKREGTPAAKVKDQVPYPIKVNRSKEMRALADKMRLEYMEEFVGQTREVLFEQEKNGLWLGTTDNYLQVELKSNRDLKNTLLPVRLGVLKKNGRFKVRAVS